MLALSAAVAIISRAPVIRPEVMGKVALMTGIVTLLGFLVVAIAKVEDMCDVHASIETIGSLSLLLIALSGAMVVVSLASKLTGGLAGILAGVAGFVIFVAAMATLLGALGAIVNKFGDLKNYETAIEIFNYIGEALGTLCSSYYVGLISGLSEIGNILSQFMTNVQGFLAGLDGFDDESANAVANLVNILGQLFAGKFKIKDAEKNAEMYARLTANMEALMPSLIAFADNCKDINTEGLDAGCKAIEALVTASNNIPNSGGLFGGIVGNNDWATFGKGLADLGSAIKSFSE